MEFRWEEPADDHEVSESQNKAKCEMTERSLGGVCARTLGEELTEDMRRRRSI